MEKVEEKPVKKRMTNKGVKNVKPKKYSKIKSDEEEDHDFAISDDDSEEQKVKKKKSVPVSKGKKATAPAEEIYKVKEEKMKK